MFIIAMAAYAGMFSPLASNIYFPAIPTLAHEFKQSTQKINLTVTVYLVFQGITPTLWGAVADSSGRRPVYIASLTVFLLACIGLALTPTSDYWLLMILRCLSASGSAIVIALGSGTVGDLAEPSERGKFMGAVMIGPMFGPCIGPVFGGLLNSGFGWRAIFWFLVILAAGVLVPMIFFFPETLRTIVGNGSIPANGWSVPVWDTIMKRRRRRLAGAVAEEAPVQTNVAKTETNPFIALKYFLEKDVAVILFFNAINCMVFYIVTATLSTILEQNYGLSTSKAGLCYLPIGVGTLLGTITCGRLLDRDFRIAKQRLSKQCRVVPPSEGQPKDPYRAAGPPTAEEAVDEKRSRDSIVTQDHPLAAVQEPQPAESLGQRTKMDVIPFDHNDLSTFPIEHARLRAMPFFCVVFWGSVIAYGWLVQHRINLAAPLIFQFIIGYSIINVMQTNQVLLVDLYPGKGASVTANNNLCRCLVGAVGTAVVNPIMNVMNTGLTMILFTGLCAIFSPLMILEWKMGMKWRASRAERVRRQAQEMQSQRN